MSTRWRVEFYTDRRGDAPVKYFLDNLITALERTKFHERLELLAMNGAARLCQTNYAKQLRGKENQGLYELRVVKTTNNPRILFCEWPGNRYVLLVGFKEKSGRDTVAAAKVANNCMSELARREEN